jgi:hypothetical protein
MTPLEQARALNKELNFIKGYLAYLRCEDPLFKEFSKRYDYLKSEFDYTRKTYRLIYI